MKWSRYSKQGYRLLLFLSLLAVTAPLVLFCFFSHPAADDYAWAARFRDENFFALQKDVYLHWQGRYFSTPLLAWLSFLTISQDIYWLIPALQMLLMAAALYYGIAIFFRYVAGSRPSTATKLVATLLFFLVYTYSLPSVAQGYFWLSGSITYQLATCCIILYMALLVKIKAMEGRSRDPRAIPAAALLAFVIAGSNELSAILLLLVTMLAARNNRVVMIIVVLAVGASLFSPGSWQRSSMIGEKQWMKILVSVPYWSLQLWLNIFKEPLFWALLAGSAWAGRVFGMRDVPGAPAFGIRTFTLVSLFFVLPLIALSPLLYASNGSMPPRMLNILTLPLLVIAFYCSYRYGAARSVEFTSAFTRPVRILLPVLILASGNTMRSYDNILQGWCYDKIVSCEEDLRKAGGPLAPGAPRIPYPLAAEAILERYPLLDLAIVREKVRLMPDMIAWYYDFQSAREEAFINLYYNGKR